MMATKGLTATWRPHPQQLAATATQATRELDGMMATKPDEWFPARELDGMMATKGLTATWRPHPQQLAATATQATRELDGMMATKPDEWFPARELDGMMATKKDGLMATNDGYMATRNLKIHPDPRQLKVGATECLNCYPHWKSVMATDTVMI